LGSNKGAVRHDDVVVRDPTEPMLAVGCVRHPIGSLDGGRDSLFDVDDLTRRKGPYFALGADAIVASAALVLGVLLLSLLSDVPDNSLRHLPGSLADHVLFIPGVLVATTIAGTYRSPRRWIRPTTFGELRASAMSIGAGGFLALGVGSALHRWTGTPSPRGAELTSAALVGIVLIPLGRSFARRLSKTRPVRVLIIGTAEPSDRIEAHLRKERAVEVVGTVIDEVLLSGASVLDGLKLIDLCARAHVDRIVVSFPCDPSDDVISTLRTLQQSVQISIVPRFYEFVSCRSKVEDLFGIPLVDVAPRDISRSDRALKRGFDIVVGSMTLAVMAPGIAVLLAWCKFTTPGPALFRQTRIGRNGRPFTILKLRTMHTATGVDAERLTPYPQGGGLLHEVRGKGEEGERLIPGGRFLRRSGLDELPQLLNVLRGDMSLVGPRPFVPTESAQLNGWASRRYEVRPGITGLWQVSGRNDVTFEELRRLDYLYVASWSFWWDLKILWETPVAAIRGNGAY
jgi:exopolysaccharide biosynthesis polyprenyl glycosylphosphotransferase